LKQNDPVIIFEYTVLLNTEAEINMASLPTEISKGKVRREGKDISIITNGGSVHKCLSAAEQLASSGIDAEVVDLRIVRPLDEDIFLTSVKKTHKVLLVEEAWKSLGVSSEVSARISEKIFYELDAPIKRISGLEVPIPYPKHLEDASVPQVPDIIQAVKQMLQYDRVPDAQPRS
jgi:pyruvate dehydrogenase E1 component beta subunit